MGLLNTVSSLNNALNTVHQLTGSEEKPTGELKNKGTHWSVRIMQGGVIVGIIVAIVACIFGNYPLALCGLALAAVSGLAWFWLRELSLLDGLDTYINELVPIIEEISKFILQQTTNLEKERESTENLKVLSGQLHVNNTNLGEKIKIFETTAKKENEEQQELNKELKKREQQLEVVVKKIEMSDKNLQQEKLLNVQMAQITKELKSTIETEKKEKNILVEENQVLKNELEKLKQEITLLSNVEKKLNDDVKVTKNLLVEFEETNKDVEKNLKETKQQNDDNNSEISTLTSNTNKLTIALDEMMLITENLKTLEKEIDNIPVKKEPEKLTPLIDSIKKKLEKKKKETNK